MDSLATKPIVSVILTSYNHSTFIREAINSVLDQSFEDFELIIWDDNSQDNSWDIIKSYSDKRIKAFKNEVNRGPCYGVNEAIFKHTKGRYIAIHHSDDIWEKNKLEQQVCFLESHSKVGAVFSNATPIDERGEPLTDTLHHYYSCFRQENRSRHQWLNFFFLNGNALCHPSILVRKNCYLECGPYRGELAQVPDLDMWIRLCSKHDIHILPDTLVRFRVRDGELNTSGDRPETRIRGIYEYYKILQQYENIVNQENIFEIFNPSLSEKYGAEFDPRFVLAKIAIETPAAHPQLPLLGLDILYGILSDPISKERVLRLHQFDELDFIRITGQHDVFLRQKKVELEALLNKQQLDFVELQKYSHTQISALIDERNNIASIATEMHSSLSWRITAPLRLAGHIFRGDFRLVLQLISHWLSQLILKVPFLGKIRALYRRVLNSTGIIPTSSANLPAIADIVTERCHFTNTLKEKDPLTASSVADLPNIDICVVTYNSSRWIQAFIDSLLGLDYPKNLLSICFVDNSSTDDTIANLDTAKQKLINAGLATEIKQRPNLGFGAGHNSAMANGTAPFCLITNIDLVFEKDSLRRLASTACADNAQAAAWEMRQKPYEHPKFYDPVTGTTNWNSHACVLLRRSAVESVGGYDDTLFMYAEDVELSYRLRRAGYLLRYCPAAVVWHYSYESTTQVKPLQYTGSTFGNLYLRLKYGNFGDIIAIPLLAIRLLASTEVFPGSRQHVAKSLFRLAMITPKTLLSRRSSKVHFPFRTWDYELTREGAYTEQQQMPVEQPLISVITRTYKGRDLYLRQALFSVAHQTWGNLEHIVVEDGGDTMRDLCEELSQITGRPVKHIANGKHGRSSAGNRGMAEANGRWCVFLDDDDLLFADHIETLANALLATPHAVASYTPALEILTDTSELDQNRYSETQHQLPSVLIQEFDFDVLLHHNYFAIQSVLFDRSLFAERGGFDEDMDALEDWILWCRFAWNNHFVYVPKVTSMFRTPDNSAKAQERNAAFSRAYPVAQAKIKSAIADYAKTQDIKKRA